MTQGFQTKIDNSQQPTTSHGLQNLPVPPQGDHLNRMYPEVDQANVWFDSYTQPSAPPMPCSAAPCPPPPQSSQVPAMGIPCGEHAPTHPVFHAHGQPVTWVEHRTVAHIKSDISVLGQSLENTRQTLLQKYQFPISPRWLIATLGPVAGLVTAGITMSAMYGGVVCVLGIAASYLLTQGMRQSAVQRQLQQKFPFEYDALRQFYAALTKQSDGLPTDCRTNEAVRTLAEQCAQLLHNAGFFVEQIPNRFVHRPTEHHCSNDLLWYLAMRPSPILYGVPGDPSHTNQAKDSTASRSSDTPEKAQASQEQAQKKQQDRSSLQAAVAVGTVAVATAAVGAWIYSVQPKKVAPKVRLDDATTIIALAPKFCHSPHFVV